MTVWTCEGNLGSRCKSAGTFSLLDHELPCAYHKVTHSPVCSLINRRADMPCSLSCRFSGILVCKRAACRVLLSSGVSDCAALMIFVVAQPLFRGLRLQVGSCLSCFWSEVSDCRFTAINLRSFLPCFLASISTKLKVSLASLVSLATPNLCSTGCIASPACERSGQTRIPISSFRNSLLHYTKYHEYD